MKPSLRLAVVPILAATVFIAPIRATSAAQVDTTVDGIFNLFRQAYDDVHAYIDQTIQDVVTALPGELDNVLNDALGELGWVDPNQIRAQIAEQLATPIDGDLAQSDPVYAAVETANEIDRQLTRAPGRCRAQSRRSSEHPEQTDLDGNNSRSDSAARGCGSSGSFNPGCHQADGAANGSPVRRPGSRAGRTAAVAPGRAANQSQPGQPVPQPRSRDSGASPAGFR